MSTLTKLFLGYVILDVTYIAWASNYNNRVTAKHKAAISILHKRLAVSNELLTYSVNALIENDVPWTEFDSIAVEAINNWNE